MAHEVVTEGRIKRVKVGQGSGVYTGGKVEWQRQLLLGDKGVD